MPTQKCSWIYLRSYKPVVEGGLLMGHVEVWKKTCWKCHETVCTTRPNLWSRLFNTMNDAKC